MKIYGIQTRSDSESHTRFPKFNFSGDPTGKAYLIGFRLGDLNVSNIHELIQVRCSTTVEAQATLIEKLFKQYGNVHIWKHKRGTFEQVILLNRSFNFLLPKEDSIERWIMNNNHYFLAFLAGYSDAEGSYYLKKPKTNVGKIPSGFFEIQTFDKNILSSIHDKLTLFNIEAHYGRSRKAGYVDKRGVRTNKDCWRIVINKKQSLWKFINLIEPYHKHVKKINDLQQVKNNIIQRNQLPYCKPINLALVH